MTIDTEALKEAVEELNPRHGQISFSHKNVKIVCDSARLVLAASSAEGEVEAARIALMDERGHDRCISLHPEEMSEALRAAALWRQTHGPTQSDQRAAMEAAVEALERILGNHGHHFGSWSGGAKLALASLRSALSSAGDTVAVPRDFLADIATSPRSQSETGGGEMAAIIDVIAELRRLATVEGWTSEHDGYHVAGDLARAAACYALVSANYPSDDRAIQRFWPWLDHWWRPTDTRRNLIKAAAFIMAEIECLDRLPTEPTP